MNKKIELELLEIWEKIKKKATVMFSDIEEIERTFGNVCIRLDGQRKDLEESRDLWKMRYMKLKEKLK